VTLVNQKSKCTQADHCY